MIALYADIIRAKLVDLHSETVVCYFTVELALAVTRHISATVCYQKCQTQLQPNLLPCQSSVPDRFWEVGLLYKSSSHQCRSGSQLATKKSSQSSQLCCLAVGQLEYKVILYSQVATGNVRFTYTLQLIRVVYKDAFYAFSIHTSLSLLLNNRKH